MSYLSARTMIESLRAMGMKKRVIARRADIATTTVDRILELPYTFIPRPTTEKRIRTLYDARCKELESDNAYREARQ